MKHLLLLAALITWLLNSAQAQDCLDTYEFFKEGTTLEYTSYNNKGKTLNKQQQTVKELKSSGDTLIAIMDVQSFDKKGNPSTSNTLPIKCFEETIYLDMRAVIPADVSAVMEGNPSIDVSLSGDALEFPKDLAPGKKLADCAFFVKASMGSMTVMNNEFRMYNRMVESNETLDTPAGSFACYKISYDFEFKYMGTRTYHCEYWYTPDVGMVKSITYDKKGNLESTMELTKLVKGRG